MTTTRIIAPALPGPDGVLPEPLLPALVPPETGWAPGAVLLCDARAVTAPTLRTVDTLARLALAARRAGLPLRLTGVPAPLRGLLVLTGLAATLGLPEP
ncbi:hypothetical protein ACN20G_08545 [Streptomyces sp. BI20]|uniref:STAS domain-containing protein n=1 Tax=Streptomyces sp. BI20 TaxID=3403460 RepID=UPI003C707655